MMDTIKGMFRKKRKILAVFLDETGGWQIKKKKYENNTFEDKEGWSGKKERYVVDHTHVAYDRKTGLPVSVYHKHNPQPIPLAHQRNRDIDSVGLNNILESKVVEELFSNKGLGTLFWIMIICGANILMSIIIICIQTGVIKVAHPAAGG